MISKQIFEELGKYIEFDLCWDKKSLCIEYKHQSNKHIHQSIGIDLKSSND
jgi:hypothetical protein